MDIIDLIFDLPEKLFDLGQTLFNFLTEEVTIAGYSVSFWALLGGAFIGVLILGSIIGNIF